MGNLTVPKLPTKSATLQAGLQLTEHLYNVFKRRYFVGLTGGLVYTTGVRKDIDIIIYRNREESKFEVQDIHALLAGAGLTNIRFFGFVTKCNWKGYDVDILHPESIYEHEGDGS